MRSDTQPAELQFDGEELSAVLKGGTEPRTEPVFWEYGRKPASEGKSAIRAFTYLPEPDAKSPNVAVREGDWKLLVNADGSGVELYNLALDRNETRNVAGVEAATIARLRAAALAWPRHCPELSHFASGGSAAAASNLASVPSDYFPT